VAFWRAEPCLPAQAEFGVPAEVMTRAQACHAGTIETAAEWIAAYRAAGANHVVLRVARPSLSDYAKTIPQLLKIARSSLGSR
jgi:alkanesulfonate monooxygenase SsuD/methylene tetrahydromethanopterin reductase-like flavin-dependent oxidoreductase (luciferase family)